MLPPPVATVECCCAGYTFLATAVVTVVDTTALIAGAPPVVTDARYALCCSNTTVAGAHSQASRRYGLASLPLNTQAKGIGCSSVGERQKACSERAEQDWWTGGGGQCILEHGARYVDSS